MFLHLTNIIKNESLKTTDTRLPPIWPSDRRHHVPYRPLVHHFQQNLFVLLTNKLYSGVLRCPCYGDNRSHLKLRVVQWDATMGSPLILSLPPYLCFLIWPSVSKLPLPLSPCCFRLYPSNHDPRRSLYPSKSLLIRCLVTSWKK